MTFLVRLLDFAFKPVAVGSCLLGLSFAMLAQNTPAQTTHGINVANMERSVKPGDNWYEYCQWRAGSGAPKFRPIGRESASSQRLPT